MQKTIETEQMRMGADTQEPYFSGLLDRLALGIYRSSIEGRFIHCNRSMCRLFGYESVDQMMKQPVVNLYHSKKDRGELIRQIMENGFIDNHPVCLRKRDGDDFRGTLTAIGVYSYDGTLSYIDGVIREISENDEKLQGVIEMAGGVAHRLNQPLTIINNLILEIVDGSDPADPLYEKVRELSDQIRVLNDISLKISQIRKYESMEYVAGTRIVDIDKAS